MRHAYFKTINLEQLNIYSSAIWIQWSTDLLYAENNLPTEFDWKQNKNSGSWSVD